MTQMTAPVLVEQIDSAERSTNPTAAAPAALLVLEAIATLGPITVAQMVRALSLPEDEIWQVISALERRDWVSARISDHAFEISPKIDTFFARAHVALPEADEAREILEPVADSQRMLATVGAFSAKGEFCAMDATGSQTDLGQPRSLAFDHLALAAQSVLTPSALNRHLTAFQEKFATPEDLAMIKSGGHAANLARLQLDGLVWSATKDGFAVPLRFASGAVGAVEFAACPELGTQAFFFQEFARRLKITYLPGRYGIEARGLSDLLKLSLAFDDFIYDQREA